MFPINMTRFFALSTAILTVLTVGAWAQSPKFSDTFSEGRLDTSKWKIATYNSPDSKPGINNGKYAPSAIDFTQGMLRISVQQSAPGGPVESLGGAIISKERFGFGTYDFEMRMSSTSPTPEGDGETMTGAVSSGFVYYNKSESEIDLEFLGNENAIWISTWNNTNPSVDPTSFDRVTKKVSNKSLATGFHHYTLQWTPKAVDVYIDSTQVAHQTHHVPQSPGYIILQHRGTNSDQWGGTATPGTTRYMYVKSVSYTPMENR